MNWEAIGAIGETIGALGVILSLAYVAFQVRLNTKQMRQTSVALEEASEEALTNLATTARWKLAESEEMAKIYNTGLKDPESLNEIELFRFRSILAALLQMFQLVHSQDLHNRIAEIDWETAKPSVRRMFKTPGGRWYWGQFRQDWSPKFRQSIDELISENET